MWTFKPIEVETCVNNNVSFVGLFLIIKSHRFISYETKDLLTINKKVQYVGVLVKPTMEELEKFSKLNLDYFQLYGQYDDKSLMKIKREFKKIISTIK